MVVHGTLRNEASAAQPAKQHPIKRANDARAIMRGVLHRLLKALFVVLACSVSGVALGSTLTSSEWELAITYVGIATYLTTALVNPLLGFLLWIATSPFGRFLYLNISFGRGLPDLSLDRLSAAFALMLLMAQLAIRKRNMARLSLVDLCMLLFLFGTGISLPLAIAGPRATIQAYFDTQIVPLLVYFLAKNLISNKGAVKAATTTLLFIGGYMAFLVIREQLTGEVLFYPEGRTITYTAHLRRAVGLLGNPAFFAIIFGMVLPFNFRALFEARRRLPQLVYIALGGGMLFALYLCYNRAGWLASFLALLFMALLYPQFRRRFLPLLLVAGVVIAIFWGQISESYVITERVSAQAPINYRMNAISIGLQMISSSPFLGRGYGNFGYLYSKYASDWTQTNVLPAPHNSYVNILVSAGVAGLAPYVAVFLAIVFQGLRLWWRGRDNRGRSTPDAIDRPLLVCMLGATLVYTATIFFSDIVASPYVTMIFFFIVGAVLGSQEEAAAAARHRGEQP